MPAGLFKRTLKYRKSMSVLLKGRNKKKRLITNCNFCNKKIEYLDTVKKFNHKFCNRICSDEWKKINYPKIMKKVYSNDKNYQIRMKNMAKNQWGKRTEEEKNIFSKNVSKGVLLNLKNHPEIREKQRQARLNQIIPKKDSKPEKIIQRKLKKMGIKFKKHISVLGLTQTDMLVEPNICIFIDGCYWHGCKKCGFDNKKKVMKDKKITCILKSNGFKVIRIWEHEVNNWTMNQAKLLGKPVKLLVTPNRGTRWTS